MTGLVRKASLLTAMGLMAAGAALAGVPSASTSVIGSNIILGGQTGGVVDADCAKTITVRDAANNAVPNSKVEIDFSNCYGSPPASGNREIRIATSQPFAGMNINCATKRVWVFTNASGVAVFRVLGGANVVSSSAGGAPEGCAQVFADGQALGSLSVAAADLDGVGGVTGPDFLQFNQALFNAPACAPCYRPRVNYATVGGAIINGPDLLVFNSFLFSGSATSGSPVCAP